MGGEGVKKKRFYYHYRKCDRLMSVHFEGTCFPVQHVKCHVPCETKWNKRQPYLVMRGWASSVTIEGPAPDNLKAVIR